MNAVVYGVLGLCFAGGLFFLGLGVRNIWRALASKSWPTTPAVIVTSTAETSKSSDGSSTLNARIEARYSVSGREYVTDIVRFGQIVGSGDTSVAELIQFRYPKGANSTVSYLPGQPGVAALEPGFDAESLWLPFAGVMLMLVAVMFTSMCRNSERSGGGMSFGAALFSIIFMGIGAPMLIYGSNEIYRAKISQSWPTATGQIIYGQVDESTTTREEGRNRRRRTSTTYGARIVFEYEAGGKTRFSNRRRFGELAGADAEWADEIASRYPEGSKLNVFYDPGDPDLAILEPGINSEAYWLPGAGLAFFLFGLAVTLIIVPALRRF
jgi:hypothetical protein